MSFLVYHSIVNMLSPFNRDICRRCPATVVVAQTLSCFRCRTVVVIPSWPRHPRHFRLYIRWSSHRRHHAIVVKHLSSSHCLHVVAITLSLYHHHIFNKDIALPSCRYLRRLCRLINITPFSFHHHCGWRHTFVIMPPCSRGTLASECHSKMGRYESVCHTAKASSAIIFYNLL